jgi:hypothetical protein
MVSYIGSNGIYVKDCDYNFVDSDERKEISMIHGHPLVLKYLVLPSH